MYQDGRSQLPDRKDDTMSTTTVTVSTDSTGELGTVADDLARASLALARRFHAGATMWCASPCWPFHAHHVAVEFVHPVIVGKRALPAVTVPTGADVVASLRATVRPGDIVCALAPANDAAVADAIRRGPAWGVETVWIGYGPRPPAGSADHVIWLETGNELQASEQFVRLYHMLWELVHVCFEHPGLLKVEPECTDEVCITCSDEGRLAEVVLVEGDEAVVRTADGRERVDVSLVDAPQPGDLLLIHAGFAIGAGGGERQTA
jgi:hypothetical protein